MSKSRGEGRAPAEKSGRVIGRDKKKDAERKALDARYNQLAGEVTVRRIPPQED